MTDRTLHQRYAQEMQKLLSCPVLAPYIASAVMASDTSDEAFAWLDEQGRSGAALPEGWVAVPREATEAMRRAFNDLLWHNENVSEDHKDPWPHAYRAMLAAAPAPESGKARYQGAQPATPTDERNK